MSPTLPPAISAATLVSESAELGLRVPPAVAEAVACAFNRLGSGRWTSPVPDGGDTSGVEFVGAGEDASPSVLHSPEKYPMPYAVDFHTVSTVGLESSPVAAALAGMRANEARYFHDKCDHRFVVEPASEAQATIAYVHDARSS